MDRDARSVGALVAAGAALFGLGYAAARAATSASAPAPPSSSAPAPSSSGGPALSSSARPPAAAGGAGASLAHVGVTPARALPRAAAGSWAESRGPTVVAEDEEDAASVDGDAVAAATPSSPTQAAAAPAPLSSPARAPAPARAGPVIVGVAGASGSGKTSLGGLIARALHAMHTDARCADISMDSFYRGLPPGTDAATHNFDEPAALDVDLLVSQLEALRSGGRVRVPAYSFVTHTRLPDDDIRGVTLDGRALDVVILDGIFVLADARVRAQLDVAVFCAEDMDVCLLRRLKRDIVERGRSVDSVIHQYVTFVRPGYLTHVRPSEQFADIIIPRAKHNPTAVRMLARECARQIEARQRAEAAAAARGAGAPG